MLTSNQIPKTIPYSEWFAAQQAIIGNEGVRAIRETALFIAGAGGLGSNVAVFAARAGFQRIFQCDPQLVEPDNLNRIPAGSRHIGVSKVAAVREFLQSFDREGSDADFVYHPLPFRVEDKAIEPYLAQAHVLVACPNSLDARRSLLRYATSNAKPLLNVGFSCSPGEFMGGEVSIYRPGRPDLACPGCQWQGSGEITEATDDPLFFPPLALLAALVVHLLTAEITNFDSRGDRRPNFYSYDAWQHELCAFSMEPDPHCGICHSNADGEEPRR